MADGVELATAWVRLVPSAEGITDSITGAFAPSEKAGADAGSKAGAAWAGKLKGAIGVAAIGAAVVGSFKGLYEVGSIFDDVTDTIRVGTGAQGEALDGLVQVAKNVGTTMPASFDQIGSTVADLNTRLGLSGETLQTVASQYLEAGRILGEDVDINATSAAFSAFRVQGDAVSGAMDTLFQISQATGVGINDLATKTKTAAPLVSNLGFSFEDTASLIGTLDKAGLDANKMLATLGPGLVKMSKDGEQPAEVFPRIVGELQSFIDKGDVASAIDLAGGIFGTRGAAQFVAALQSGVVNLDDLQSAVGATGDTILGVGAETADFGEQWQIFKNMALTAIEPIGTAIFNVLGKGMAFVNSLFDQLMDFSGPTSGLVAVLGPLLSTFAEMGQIIWSSLGPALKQVWAAVAPLIPVLLDLWMSVSPVNLVFKALAPVLPMIADMIGQLAAVLGGMLAAVLPPVVELVASLGGILGALFEALLPVVMTLVEALFPIMEALIPVVVGLLAAFTPLIGALVEALAPILQVVAQIAAAILVPAFNLVAGVVKVLATVITWLVQNVIAPYFNGIVIPIVKAVAAAFKGNFGPLGAFFSGLWDGIVAGFKWFINVLIDGINGFVGGLNEVGNFISDVTGGAIDFRVPRLPRLALGATILPRPGGTAAILAEAGKPETVVDTGLLNRALEEGIAGSSGGGDTYMFNGQFAMTPEEIGAVLDRRKRAAYFRSGALVKVG